MTHADKMKQRNQELINIINRTNIVSDYCHSPEKLLDEKIAIITQNANSVLDFGKSSRSRYDLFKEGQIETADINQYDGYPDFICDICDSSTFPQKKYDAIICNAVLEHVYDPAAAVKNMHDTLNDGGTCLCYAPFIYNYHAPEDLKFQDYFRFTRDGLSYLFRDFSDVTLYSMRGKISSGVHFMFPAWKHKVERRFSFANKFLDRFLGGSQQELQASGYIIWAIKK